MTVQFPKELWNSSNFLGKACFIIGFFFIDTAMRISGVIPTEGSFEQNEETEDDQ